MIGGARREDEDGKWRRDDGNKARYSSGGVSMRLPDSAQASTYCVLVRGGLFLGKNSRPMRKVRRSPVIRMISTTAISSALVAEMACRPGLSLSCLACRNARWAGSR